MASKGKSLTLPKMGGGEDRPLTLWESFQKTQTLDSFKRVLPFRPNSTNNLVEFVIVGDPARLESAVNVEALLLHLEAFIGFPVQLREGHLPLPGSEQAAPAHRASVSSHVSHHERQVGAHFVLAQ